jgi:hypothetical protein
MKIIVQLGAAAGGRGAEIAHALQQIEHVQAAAARRQHRLDLIAVEHRAHAVAVAREHAGQHGHELGRHQALGARLRAEVDASRQVEHEPGVELPVLGELAHVGTLQARRDVPVDVAHVVVQLVFAQVGQVQPGAAEQGAVVPLQQPVETADHRPLEAAQDGVRAWRAHRDGGPAACRVSALFARSAR